METEGREVARIGRRDRGGDSQEIRHVRREQAAGAAEGDHRVVAGIETPCRGDGADTLHLIGCRNFEDAGGGILG